VSGFAAARRRDGLVAATLTCVEEWLLDPVAAPPAPPAPSAPRPVVAVVALAPRCGCTTVARGLAATLAAREAPGAAIACGPSGSVALSLSTPAATRLGRAVGDFVDAPYRVSGRLCLVDVDARSARAAALRNQAALVIDVPHGGDAGAAAALADVVVLVAGPAVEPALAAVVGAALAGAGTEPLLVVSRPGEGVDWSGSEAIVLPDARLASRLALAGREPPGALGAALGRIADRCERVMS
jgi:hypothetical protein